MSPWDRIQARLEPLRNALLNHHVYGQIHNPAALRLFMQHHIFAVWDFMSLLKALQRNFTCVNVPWTPPADPCAARLVNEIVLAEESDVGSDGQPASHFDLYLLAMRDAGADVGPVERLIDDLRRGMSLNDALRDAGVAPAAAAFVQQTFAVIESETLPAIASAFTFGREDLLPGLFTRIVDEQQAKGDGTLDTFRHIDLDGGEHGPMARRLVESICGDREPDWRAAESAAVDALRSRLTLWDAMAEAISAANA